MVATGVPVSILSLELTDRNHNQVLEIFQSIKQQSNTSQPYFATREEMKELIHDSVSKAIAEERMREDVYSTHRFSYSRQILNFCKFVLICPFLSCICLDKNKTIFFVLVDQESL